MVQIFKRKFPQNYNEHHNIIEFILFWDKKYGFRILLQFSTEIKQKIPMLQQFFKSSNKSFKGNTALQFTNKENICKPMKVNKTIQYVNDRLQTDSTEVEPLRLIQNFDLPDSVFTTLRKPRKFQRKPTLNSSKVNKTISFTQRKTNCQQDTINQLKQSDEKQNRERQGSGSILFPKRDTKRSEVSMGKKKHLVRTSRAFPVTSMQEELKNICRQSSDEIGNIKPLRMCLQEFIYCTGKRAKYIPMNSILKTPPSYADKLQNQIPTQSTISNFRQLASEKRKPILMRF